MSIYVLMWRALCPSFSPIGNNYFSHLLYPCVSEIVRQGGFAEEPGYMPSTARGKLGQLPGTKLWHLSCSFPPPTLMLLLPSIPCYSCCPPSSTKSSSAPFFLLERLVRFNTFDILAPWAKRVNWGRSYCKFSIPFPEVGNVNIRFTNHHAAVHPRSSWQLGKTSFKKECFLSGIAEITLPCLKVFVLSVQRAAKLYILICLFQWISSFRSICQIYAF